MQVTVMSAEDQNMSVWVFNVMHRKFQITHSCHWQPNPHMDSSRSKNKQMRNKYFVLNYMDTIHRDIQQLIIAWFTRSLSIFTTSWLLHPALGAFFVSFFHVRRHCCAGMTVKRQGEISNTSVKGQDISEGEKTSSCVLLTHSLPAVEEANARYWLLWVKIKLISQ